MPAWGGLRPVKKIGGLVKDSAARLNAVLRCNERFPLAFSYVVALENQEVSLYRGGTS